jgi:hypothetical protein
LPVDVVRTVPKGASEAELDAFVGTAIECIKTHGFVILKDVLPKSYIDEALAHFHDRYAPYMKPGQKRLFRNFQDDPLRAQIPVAIDGPIAAPLLFYNPVMIGIVHRLMGKKVIIGELGGIINHPGSKPQYIHRDSDFLFGGHANELELPPHSLNMVIPLIDATPEVGPTEFWAGSHRRPDRAAVLATEPESIPMETGSIFMLDARLLHRGAANRSNLVRPAIYMNYHKAWYLENSGYKDKPQLRVTPAMVKKLAPEHRYLFEWALHLNKIDSVDEFIVRWMGRARNALQKS